MLLRPGDAHLGLGDADGVDAVPDDVGRLLEDVRLDAVLAATR